MKDRDDIVLVTAASDNHLYSLLQLINTIYAHERGLTVYVYDIGFSEESIQKIKSFTQNYHTKTMNIILKKFDFEKWGLKRSDLKDFGWKAPIIHETYEEVGAKKIIWSDAGNMLVSNLDELISFLNKNKIYSPTTGHSIRGETYGGLIHPDTVLKMDVGVSIDLPSRGGGVIGLDFSSDWASNFLKEFVSFSLDKSVIAPEGSSKRNHRQDQAVFSLLYEKYRAVYGFERPRARIGLDTHYDIE